MAEAVTADELSRAIARIELSLLQGLSNNEGKASTIGFYEVVLGNPSASFDRLAALASVRVEHLLEVARRYLVPSSRTVILVQPQGDPEDDVSGDDAEEVAA
jgi:predicted Zn-dependent peptidase